MRYFNTVKVDEVAWKNINEFIKGKNPSDDLFDKINASSLNEYLRSLMEGLTAKVFRTYNASYTLEKELNKRNVEDDPLEEKVNYYDEANKQVAILCNHQKTIPKNFDIMKEKISEKIDVLRQYLEELNSHLKLFKKKPNVEAREVSVVIGKKDEKASKTKEGEPKDSKEAKAKGKDSKEEKTNIYVKKFPNSEEKTKALIKKIGEMIPKEEAKLSKKEETKAIALGTSKINYNDPRITVAWCKRNEVPIEKVFTKALRTKFPWAMYGEPDWKF